MHPAAEGALPGPAAAASGWDARALPRGVVLAGVVLALGLVALLAWQLRSVLVLVLIATTIAYIVEPLVRRAQGRLRVPRLACAVLAGAVVAALEVLGAGWLLPQVAREALALASDLPELVARLAERFDLQAVVERASREGGAGWVGERAVELARAAAGRTASTVAFLLLLPVLVGMFVAHLPGARSALAYVPRGRRPEVRRLLRTMDDAVGGFFRGRIIICAIVGALLALGWWLCGVPHALALGFLAGVLNLVPYASGLAWVLAVLLGVAAGAAGEGSFSWFAVALWPTVVFAAVNLLENSLLTPWIQSQAVNLSALTVMLATLVGGSLAGALGLFYAIPLAACLKALLRDVALPRLRAWAEAP